MNQLNSTQTKGVCLLNTLSRTVKAQRRSLTKKLFGYRKIRPKMTLERDEVSDLSEVILQECSDVDTQVYPCHSEHSQSVLTFRLYPFSVSQALNSLFYGTYLY